MRRIAAVGVVGCVTPLLAAQQSHAPTPPSGFLLALPSAPAIRGRHLDATPSASLEAVVAGKPFALRLDVIPNPGVHVYAPGNASYAAVTLSVDRQPGIVVGPLRYPKSVEFFFAPLKERVRVFSSSFRLERQVTVDASVVSGLAISGAPALTLLGRLEYQACDDRVCYLPQTLPLTWTVAVKR